MTNELEKTFFDMFGIKPKYYCGDHFVFEAMLEDECTDNNREKCKICKHVRKSYPQITDSILLELICIDFTENPYKCRGYIDNIEELKERILSDFIHEFENDLYWDKESVKHQVRTLFEEG